MTKLIFATGNMGKMKEIRDILAGENLEILSMKEAGIAVEVEEDGASFEENALIKARAIASLAQDAIVMADDSGLEVDYLDGFPGIFSARFMGEDTSYDIKNQAILDKLEGVAEADRTARFVCAIAAVLPSGEALVVRETMEGYIGYAMEGENGFGYDPIFMLPEYGCTSATISVEEKNSISHRAKALASMKLLLKEANIL